MRDRPNLDDRHFTTWGDHKAQLPINNEMSKTKPGRVARRRSKVQELRYTDKCLQGKPGDYTTCQAAHIKDSTEEEKKKRKVDKGEDIQEKGDISKDSRQEDSKYEDEGAGRHGKHEDEGVRAGTRPTARPPSSTSMSTRTGRSPRLRRSWDPGGTRTTGAPPRTATTS
jgi:hypothetical protein